LRGVQGDRHAWLTGLFRPGLPAFSGQSMTNGIFGFIRTEAPMLGPLDLAIYGFVAVILLPIVLVSLFTGSKPPENTFFTKYYRAETHLMLVGNIFLLAVCSTAIVKLALHFGAIDAGQETTITNWINLPFLLLLVLFLVMLIRAVLKVRRDGTTA
jgi:hypothetical protein